MYLWLKAAHIIAVIAWMAGLLYLPRLMVYHVGAEPGSKQSETFKVMEWRLYYAIMSPAMVTVWITGPLLAWQSDMYADRWLAAKFVGVLGLTWCHHALRAWMRVFAADKNTRSAKFYRIFNEIPTLLMIAIVILVVVKPF